jgi:integrase
MRSRRKSGKADRVVRHVLADGTEKIYRYSSYKRRKQRGDTINDLLAAYCGSPEWANLSESTRLSYATYHQVLLPVGHLEVKSITRRDLLDLRDAVAKARGDGAASNFVRATSVLFNWGVDREWMETSPAYRIKTLPGGHLPAWSQQDAVVALDRLPEHLRRVVLLAAYTGQARLELCRVPWSAYDGDHIRFVRQKTRRKTGDEEFFIPVHPVLGAELDRWPRLATTILTNQNGLPWKPAELSVYLPLALAKIGLGGRRLNTHGLRKLAAANLAEAGCSTHEIAAITNHHTLSMVELYTRSANQKRLAKSAVVKLSDFAGLQRQKNDKKSQEV